MRNTSSDRRCFGRPGLVASLAFLLGGFSAVVAACKPFEGDGTGGGASTGSTGSTTGTQATGSTGTGVDPRCTPMTGNPVAADCGVFVKAGSTGGDGSQASPVGTLGEAVAIVASGTPKPIYVCTGAFDEAVDLQPNVSLFGGLDCTSGYVWKDVMNPAERSTLTAASDQVPLTVEAGTATIYGFVITSKNATTPGKSSVGLAIQGGGVTLELLDVHAGDGAKGTSATSPGGMAAGGVMGTMGGHYSNATTCLMVNAIGALGAPAVNNPNCADSTGGKGGDGGKGNVVGGPGDSSGDAKSGVDGMPLVLNNHGLGGGCAAICNSCTAGTAGMNGGQGDPGVAGMGLGMLSALGVEGSAGGTGFPGHSGQGGGGGGGQRTSGMAACGGDGGASGGAGGCGGAGGPGGGYGGSSIGIVSLGAALSFDQVRVTVGHGADGGAGAAGQLGGIGLAGGPATGTGGCAGGKGGDGGQGGTGAGGSGGHAVGLAFTGAMPDVSKLSVDLTAAVAGSGGMGGNAGPMGTAVETLAF